MSDTLFVILIVGGFWVWFALLSAAKDLIAGAKDRRDDRIMAEYQRDETARLQQYEAARPPVPKLTAEEKAAMARDAHGDFLVIFHPHKERPFVHDRYSTYERAAARCDQLQPREEYTEMFGEIFFNGWAVVQTISGLAETPDGRRYLRELGIERSDH